MPYARLELDFSHSHLDISGSKRSFGDMEDDEDDIFGSKKVPFVIIRTIEILKV